MPYLFHIQRRNRAHPPEVAEPETSSDAAATREKVNADTDRLLDEIDELLDDAMKFETADVFVSQFVQRGGQ